MKSTVAILRRLLRYGTPHRALLLYAFGAMAVLGLTTGAYAWLMGPALQFLLTGGTDGLGALSKVSPELGGIDRERALWLFPVIIVGIGVVKGIAYLAQFYWAGLYGQKVALEVRRDLFSRLSRLSPREASSNRVGDLLSRFTQDVAHVEVAATYTVSSFIRDSLQIVILAAVALSLNWRLALATMIIVPLAAWPASRITRSFLKRTREGQAGLGVMAAQVHEGIAGLRTVQAFNAEDRERARFDVQAAAQVRAVTRAAWLRGGVPGMMEILAAGALAGVLAFAASTRAVSAAELISLLTAILLVYQPVKDLGRVTQFALQAAAAGERLFAVLDAPDDARLARGTRSLSPVQRGLRLEEVHFAWGERAALRGVSLEIPTGKVTALVGPSGGGKSSLISLLMRFDLPQQGRITVDGHDAADATVQSVRAQFALVTQEPLLFSTSIADNIRFSRPEATFAQVEAAARVAMAHTFISELPQGYQTLVGERGVRLSGGQKQRVCLARAVLAGAPVLVLDEATSNLDPHSEREVQDALEKVLEGRTALVVAHRLSTIARADLIYVLDAGRVVESGSHGELVARGGLYARMWALQNPDAGVEAGAA